MKRFINSLNPTNLKKFDQLDAYHQIILKEAIEEAIDQSGLTANDLLDSQTLEEIKENILDIVEGHLNV